MATANYNMNYCALVIKKSFFVYSHYVLLIIYANYIFEWIDISINNLFFYMLIGSIMGNIILCNYIYKLNKNSKFVSTPFGFLAIIAFIYTYNFTTGLALILIIYIISYSILGMVKYDKNKHQIIFQLRISTLLFVILLMAIILAYKQKLVM